MTFDVSTMLAGHTWLCEPSAIKALIDRMRAVAVIAPGAAELSARAARASAQSGDPVITDGVAHVRIAGFMMPKVSPLLEWYGEILGIDFTGTEAVRSQVAKAVENEAVTAIHLTIDSPGGTVEGTAALADDLAAAASFKPMTADVRNLMASAALWAGVQATKITAGQTAVIGSIGVFTVLHDASALAEKEGVTVHLVASGAAKGSAFGAPVSDAKLANTQAMVDAMAKQFTAAVAKGRKLSAAKASELSTGEVWVGAQAVALGLADAITADTRAIKQSTGAAASEEKSTMTKEEQAELAKARAEADEAKAKNASLEASLRAVGNQRREDMVAKYPDRVVPANRAAVLAYGEFCGEDLAKFEGHIKTLPVLTRADPIGNGGPADPTSAPPSVSAAAEQLAEVFTGTAAEIQAAFDDTEVVGVLATGKLAMKAGNKRGWRSATQAEMDKRKTA